MHGAYWSDGTQTLCKTGRSLVLPCRYAVNTLLIFILITLYNRVHNELSLWTFIPTFLFFSCTDKMMFVKFFCLLLYLEIFIDVYMQLFPLIIFTPRGCFRSEVQECFYQRLKTRGGIELLSFTWLKCSWKQTNNKELNLRY